MFTRQLVLAFLIATVAPLGFAQSSVIAQDRSGQQAGEISPEEPTSSTRFTGFLFYAFSIAAKEEMGNYEPGDRAEVEVSSTPGVPSKAVVNCVGQGGNQRVARNFTGETSITVRIRRYSFCNAYVWARSMSQVGFAFIDVRLLSSTASE